MSSIHFLQSNKSIYFTQMCFSDQPSGCDKPSKFMSTERNLPFGIAEKSVSKYLFTQHKIVYV